MLPHDLSSLSIKIITIYIIIYHYQDNHSSPLSIDSSHEIPVCFFMVKPQFPAFYIFIDWCIHPSFHGIIIGFLHLPSPHSWLNGNTKHVGLFVPFIDILNIGPQSCCNRTSDDLHGLSFSWLLELARLLPFFPRLWAFHFFDFRTYVCN